MRICLLIIGFVAIILTADPSKAATVGRRGQTPVITDQNNNNQKSKGRNIIHPAFANAGKKAGLEIWRIQSFEPVAVAQNDYGKFHTGDSYICLFTKEKNGVFSWDLHFWLGQETSQDESGAAAALTVQLDDQLGGTPVQYREVQDHESQIFKSHFKNGNTKPDVSTHTWVFFRGIRYVPGGVPSGLRHVTNSVEKKMYQIKGKKNVRVKQVEYSVASMNKGDCFILDNGNDIFVYQGPNAKRVEKLKSVSAANLVRDQDHGGRSKITVIDEYSTEDEAQKFFTALGSGSPTKIPDESSGGDDDQFEKQEESAVILYKVSDAAGKIKVDKLTQKPLKQEMLNTNECFILDTERADVYVWVGRKSNAKEKSEAMSKAQEFITSKKYPSWVKVRRVVENAEPSVFRQYFQTWQGAGELHSRLIRSMPTADQHIRAYHLKLSNDKLSVHHVSNFEQEDLDENDVIIIDTESDVYIWYGKNSSAEERKQSWKKAEKLLTINNLTITSNSNPAQLIEVNQGEEQENFIHLFQQWNPNLWN